MYFVELCTTTFAPHSNGLFNIGDEDKFDWGGIIGAIIGAIIVVAIASALFRRTTHRQHLT